jgi:hypothetical protein
MPAVCPLPPSRLGSGMQPAVLSTPPSRPTDPARVVRPFARDLKSLRENRRRTKVTASAARFLILPTCLI